MTTYDFVDVNHAAGYLNNSIISWQGNPTYVHTIDQARDSEGRRKRGGKMVANHSPLSIGRDRTDPLSSLSYDPMNLGMYNCTRDDQIREAIWLERVPARRWKVGITKNGLRYYPLRPEVDNLWWERVRENRGFQAWYLNGDMNRMLKGEYPNYDRALEMMRGYTRMSVAFSPNFAIQAGKNALRYRRHPEPVGTCRAIGPDLFQKYAFLREMLEEDLERA